MKKDRIKEKIQKFINFEDEDSRDDLDKMLEELFNMGKNEKQEIKDEFKKIRWKKLTNKEIVREWALKRQIKEQVEVGNTNVGYTLKVMKGEIYKRQ